MTHTFTEEPTEPSASKKAMTAQPDVEVVGVSCPPPGPFQGPSSGSLKLEEKPKVNELVT